MNKTSGLASVVVALSLASASSAVFAQQVDSSLTVEGSALVVRDAGRESRVALGCAGGAVIRQATRAFVACGLAGVVEIDLTDASNPRRVAVRDAGGEVVGFFAVDGAVWARITRTEARPVDALAARGDTTPVSVAAASVSTEPRSPTVQVDARRVGHVVSVALGDAVIDLGTGDGVAVGGRVEFFRERWTRLDEGDRAMRIDSLAVGEVTAISARRARVRIGTDERVAVGASARPTSTHTTQNTLAPPRLDGVWELHGALRPFLSLEHLAVGAITDFEVVYRASGPWVIHAGAIPLAFALGQQPVFNYGVMLTAGYDSRLFEVGLGIGAASNRSYGGDPSNSLALGQRVRLGAVDGLNLDVQNAFLLGRERFRYGGTIATLQVPVSAASALVFRGGGGNMGYVFGEVGLRIRVRGNGDRGSLFVTPSVGGAAIFGRERECPSPFDGSCYPGSVSHGGPLVGLGVEYRL